MASKEFVRKIKKQKLSDKKKAQVITVTKEQK